MKDRAIILGIAPCLEEDLNNVSNHSLYDFFAIGVDCSDRVVFDIQHACSYHPYEFEEFRQRRKRIGGNLDYVTHSHAIPADRIWPLVARTPESGSSSFLGCQVAVGLGYRKVILCGCPMTGSNSNPKKSGYETFRIGWQKHAKRMFGDKVRSMSGWTKEFLGFPDEEWLKL